jgi:hypothetical protein
MHVCSLSNIIPTYALLEAEILQPLKTIPEIAVCHWAKKIEHADPKFLDICADRFQFEKSSAPGD